MSNSHVAPTSIRSPRSHELDIICLSIISSVTFGQTSHNLRKPTSDSDSAWKTTLSESHFLVKGAGPYSVMLSMRCPFDERQKTYKGCWRETFCEGALHDNLGNWMHPNFWMDWKGNSLIPSITHFERWNNRGSLPILITSQNGMSNVYYTEEIMVLNLLVSPTMQMQLGWCVTFTRWYIR